MKQRDKTTSKRRSPTCPLSAVRCPLSAVRCPLSALLCGSPPTWPPSSSLPWRQLSALPRCLPGRTVSSATSDRRVPPSPFRPAGCEAGGAAREYAGGGHAPNRPPRRRRRLRVTRRRPAHGIALPPPVGCGRSCRRRTARMSCNGHTLGVRGPTGSRPTAARRLPRRGARRDARR